MSDIGAFFRRNRKFLWFVIATFMTIFVSIQFSKALSTLDSNYGEIAECNYTHQAPELQTPRAREEEQVSKYCSTRS